MAKTKTGAAYQDERCPKRSEFMKEDLPHVGNFYCAWCHITIKEKRVKDV